MQYPPNRPPGHYLPQTAAQPPYGGFTPLPTQRVPRPESRRWPSVLRVLVAAGVILFIVAARDSITFSEQVTGPTAVFCPPHFGGKNPCPVGNHIALAPGCGDQGEWNTNPNAKSTCQPDGDGLVLQQQDPSQAAVDYFLGTIDGEQFAHNYSVQVQAAVARADVVAVVGLAVHNRYDASSQTYTPGQLFLAGTDGSWVALRFDASSSALTQLGSGPLPQATQSLTLRVDVQGTRMTFTVNRAPVAQIIDPTYTDTSSVALVIFPMASTAISVVFSRFSYMET